MTPRLLLIGLCVMVAGCGLSCDAYECRHALRLDAIASADYLVSADVCWVNEPGVTPQIDSDCMKMVMSQYDSCWLNTDTGKDECELRGQIYPL